MTKTKSTKPVVVWLSIVCFLVYAMVLVGGITRLTDSGLSITQWKPISGALPPLSERDWQENFSLYKQTPEYRLVNAGMGLDQFKFIFFWEWFHRLLGRLIGVAFALPLLFFQFRGYLKNHPGLSLKLWVGFFLGGSQGLLGWYMVKSGLVDRPDVSHIRLAAHLVLALFIFSYLFWNLLSLWRKTKPMVKNFLFWSTITFLGLLTLQVTWGAFTAGLKAGVLYSTFPDMAGYFFPPEGTSMNPLWLNFFENPATIHFTHRILGWTLLLLGFFLCWRAFMSPLAPIRRLGLALGATLSLQFILGVLVVALAVPISLAALHQTGAFVLLIITLTFLYFQKPPSEDSL